MKKLKMFISFLLFLLFTSSQVKAGEAKIFDLCNLENHRRCFVKVIKAYGKDKWDYPDPRCQYAPKVTSDLLY